MLYAFPERLKSLVLKVDKSASKFVNEKEYGQSKNE